MPPVLAWVVAGAGVDFFVSVVIGVAAVLGVVAAGAAAGV